MSTIKSLPSDSTFNSVMEAKSSSLGFHHQKYGQQHSAKKNAQDILQKKLAQINHNQKKQKKPVEELAIPVVISLSAPIQNVSFGTKVAFLSSSIEAEVTHHSVNQTATELDNGPVVFEGRMPLESVLPQIGRVSTSPIFNTETVEQKAARFLPNKPMSGEQSLWKDIPMGQPVEPDEMTTLASSLPTHSPNAFSEEVLTNKNSRETNDHKPQTYGNQPVVDEGKLAPSESLEMQNSPDTNNLSFDKSELIQSDEMDITKNILAQMKAESVVRLPVSTQMQSTQASLKQTAELVATMMASETLNVAPERTLSYTFSQWQNMPSVSFSLAHASHENMVASTYSHEVQQALEDNRHLFTGEQKMVIKREEREGQHRQQQQQNKQQDEEF